MSSGLGWENGGRLAGSQDLADYLAGLEVTVEPERGRGAELAIERAPHLRRYAKSASFPARDDDGLDQPAVAHLDQKFGGAVGRVRPLGNARRLAIEPVLESLLKRRRKRVHGCDRNKRAVVEPAGDLGSAIVLETVRGHPVRDLFEQ